MTAVLKLTPKSGAFVPGSLNLPAPGTAPIVGITPATPRRRASRYGAKEHVGKRHYGNQKKWQYQHEDDHAYNRQQVTEYVQKRADEYQPEYHQPDPACS